MKNHQILASEIDKILEEFIYSKNAKENKIAENKFSFLGYIIKVRTLITVNHPLFGGNMHESPLISLKIGIDENDVTFQKNSFVFSEDYLKFMAKEKGLIIFHIVENIFSLIWNYDHSQNQKEAQNNESRRSTTN